MTLARINPLFRALNRWPSVWEDDDLLDMPTTTNNLDVYETEDEVVIKANVAGVPAEKVDVTFEKGVLWVKAQREEEKQDEERQHYSRSSWNYSYRVAVPGMIDFNQDPSAEIEDGVITVMFKKAEASRPKRLSVKTKGK
jgi:HSP20 family protein